METRIPRRLVKGDVIGIISPASPVDDSSRIEKGVRYLESLGYRTKTGRHIDRRMGYLAGTDRERVEDIHAMFTDRNVKALFCTRGGYGTPRLLSLIDYRLIARNPKIFLGYSDITALALAFWRKCRLVTYHGPMLTVGMAGEMDPFAEESLWRILSSPVRRIVLASAESLTPELKGAGSGRGRLLGGNLSLIVSLLGTPYQPDFKRTILFLEEMGEEPYRVDRMMMQLENAGILARSSGMAIGRFSNCRPRDISSPSLTVEEVLQRSAERAGKPFAAGFPFGHERRVVTVPVGVRAHLDARTGTLELLEPAVT